MPLTRETKPNQSYKMLVPIFIIALSTEAVEYTDCFSAEE